MEKEGMSEVTSVRFHKENVRKLKEMCPKDSSLEEFIMAVFDLNGERLLQAQKEKIEKQLENKTEVQLAPPKSEEQPEEVTPERIEDVMSAREEMIARRKEEVRRKREENDMKIDERSTE